MSEYIWQEPVTDRSIQDIIAAKQIVRYWKQGIVSNFDQMKGCLSASDLNRIETNTAYLAGLLNSTISPSCTWTMADIPTVSSRSLILGNAGTLRTKLLQKYPDAEISDVPTKLENYEDFNALEAVQLEIADFLEDPPEPVPPAPSSLSGVPPFAFYTTGSALQNYVIHGASGGVGDYYSTTGKYRIPVKIIRKNLCAVTAPREYGYLNENGAVVRQYPVNNYYTSDFIPIPSGIFQMTYSFYASRYTDVRSSIIHAYDENKNSVGRLLQETGRLTGDTRYSYPFDVPSSTAFIRYTWVTADQNPNAMKTSDYDRQLEIGGEATDYTNESNTFNIDLDAPLDSGDSYASDGTVSIETFADAWNFLYAETSVQPENMTIYYDAEE